MMKEISYLEKINYYKEKCEKDINYSNKIRIEIERRLKNIYINVKNIEIL